MTNNLINTKEKNQINNSANCLFTWFRVAYVYTHTDAYKHSLPPVCELDVNKGVFFIKNISRSLLF